MRVSIGSDHGGYDLKEKIKEWLMANAYEVDDKGTFSKDSCDYPVFAKAVAKDVAEGKSERGIVVCTTGIGVSITANKVKGIRCALCHNEHTATMTRLHNDSNVLAIGAMDVDEAMALKMTEIFLTTEFSGEERHARRVRMMEE